MRPGELNGKEYFFVQREKMEEEIEACKFIEYGEYKGNLYGTSTESVKAIINAGHVCILNPHYQALKMLRTPQLRPYIIYIKPPPMDVLRETRESLHARSTFDVHNSRGFTVSIFKNVFYIYEISMSNMELSLKILYLDKLNHISLHQHAYLYLRAFIAWYHIYI